MSNVDYPKPPSHKTFNFQPIKISSDFDSGNCCNALKIRNNQFHIWISTDNPKNNYRTWFHFSVEGANKSSTLSFTIKNMQNQSRLLNQGLVPVYREQGSHQWKRISEKINLNTIEYYEGWIQWTFKHYFKSTQKHFFAFFYPWSNEQNSKLLSQIQQKSKLNPQIYCYRSSICKTLQDRDIQLLVLSSTKNKSSKQQNINDINLFKDQKKPHTFTHCKPGIVISARVHPGEVPGSHVMTGIIKAIIQQDSQMKKLRDQFVFYIFPILNPDGVYRGHYRVDTNGINLNRCYINPSPKDQPSIYAVKKIIMHLHSQNRFFAFLDLHAHAARKGTFIYGNCSNQLMKQVDACIFPKLLSMNSIDFQYEGSNFTEKNMYSKDRGDHISKEGSGRVAMYKATKNAYCWTMECNYNMSRINNVLEKKKLPEIEIVKINENSLNQNLIVEYKQPQQVQAKQFFKIETYHKLGRQVCQTFLDLIQKNPQSRIDNQANYFKCVANVKMNLAVALMRMAPNRFEAHFKKIYYGLSNSQNPQTITNCLKALYFLVIRDAKIQNINNYVKTGDQNEIVLPEPKKIVKKTAKIVQAFRSRQTRYSSIRQLSNQNVNVHIDDKTYIENDEATSINQYIQPNQQNMKLQQIQLINQPISSRGIERHSQGLIKIDDEEPRNLIASKVLCVQKQDCFNRVSIKLQQFKMIKMNNKRILRASQFRQTVKSCIPPKKNSSSSQEPIIFVAKQKQLPFIGHQKYKEQARRLIDKKSPIYKDQFFFVS